MHEHKFILIKQIPHPLFVNHNYYECICGDKKETLEFPGGEEDYIPQKNGSQNNGNTK